MIDAVDVPIERKFKLEKAMDFGLQELTKLAALFEVRTIGNYYAASICQAKFDSGEVFVEACGKGGWLNSQVGAVFETIQDFYATNINDKLNSQSKIQYISSQTIAKQKYFQNDLVINILESLPDQKMPARHYKTIDSKQNAWWPLFLTNVNIVNNNPLKNDQFDYSILERYSSDNGHAAGLTTHEALLHAINECIERDAFALFLFNCFYNTSKKPLRTISKPSLPSHILSKIEEAERKTGFQIIIIDMTTDIKVTSIICITTEPLLNSALYGMGASLYSEHAIERAISELMQVYWIKKAANAVEREKNETLNKNKYQRLQEYPNHLACAKLEIKSFLRKDYVEQVKYTELPTLTKRISLTNQIQILQERIHACHLEIFYCELMHSSETGVSVVHVFIPGLEYLWAAASGKIVLPYKRALASLDCMEPAIFN